MAITELLFEFPPHVGSPVDLVFGETLDPVEPTEVHVSASLTLSITPATSSLVRSAVLASAQITIQVTGAVSAQTRYFSDTERPLVSEAKSNFQDAARQVAGSVSGFQWAAQMSVGAGAGFQDATKCMSGVRSRYQDSARRQSRSSHRFQDAKRLIQRIEQQYQDVRRLFISTQAGYQDSSRLNKAVQDGYQDTRRVIARGKSGFQDATKLNRVFNTSMQNARSLFAIHNPVRYQDAMWPVNGVHPRPQPPQEEPCYEPNPHLLFQHPWVAGDSHLVFICERKDGGVDPEPPPGKVVVPIKEVYLVINNIALIRVSDGKPIPVNSMSMSLDVDSWTWAFSAAVPGYAHADVAWQSGEPVEVQATVNGTPFRFIIEQIGRERSFGRDDLRLSGRGRSALLDAPYSPTLNLLADETLTAEQLANWVLSENGVSLGWEVDFQLIDWSVPAGVFAHQGSYMGGLTRIAEAVGGYVQPHNTEDRVHLLHRYPVKPWEWSTVEPDFELPSAVVTREGTEWALKPRYNRVYVRGEAQGVSGRITRTGTAGDMLAESVVDSLITHHDAAMQRGQRILSDVGQIATISIRLPVLAETGIIKPGNFVRYTDGGIVRTGLTRSVAVDVASVDSVWQTIAVEHHE